MRPLPRRPRALLLDDDPATRRVLGRILAARGLEVVAAAEGAGGLELLFDELLSLDVLVMDLNLPGRDACSMLRLIRGAGGEEDLAVVVLAHRPGAAVRARLLALGADEVADRAHGPEEAARAALRAAASRRGARRRAGVGRAARVAPSAYPAVAGDSAAPPALLLSPGAPPGDRVT